METQPEKFVQKLPVTSSLKIFIVVLVLALIAGLGTGYMLAKTNGKNSALTSAAPGGGNAPAPNAQADNQTFRDFAEGTIQPKPSPKTGEDYSEGAVLLQRDGAVPVALTSSVVDLTKYMGKKVKVYGETQKALKTGWLMDVGKIEVE